MGKRKVYKIGVIPGDGIGPEIISAGMEVLKSAAVRFDFGIESVYYDFGGDMYLKTGETLPDSAIEELKNLMQFISGR